MLTRTKRSARSAGASPSAAPLLALFVAACAGPADEAEGDADKLSPTTTASQSSSSGGPTPPIVAGDPTGNTPGSSASGPDADPEPPVAADDPVPAGPQCSGPRLDLTDVEASAGPFEVLDGDWSGVSRLAGNGPDLYLLGSAGLQVLRGGLAPAELLAAELPEFGVVGYSEGRGSLVFDQSHAYFTVKTGISRAALDGSGVETLFDGIGEDDILTDLVIAGDSLFFGWGGKGIYRMPLAGGAEPVLVTDALNYLGYTVAGDTLYGGADSGLYSLPTAGGTPTLVTSYTKHIFPYVGSISLFNDQLYWRDDSTVLTCPVVDCASPKELHGTAKYDLQLRGARVYSVSDALEYAALDGADCGTLIFGDFPDELGEHALTDDYAFVLGAYGADFFETELYKVPLL